MTSKFTERVRLNTAGALALLGFGAVSLWNWPLIKAARIDDVDLNVPFFLRALPWVAIAASAVTSLFMGFLLTSGKAPIRALVYGASSWILLMFAGAVLMPFNQWKYSGPPYGCRGHLRSL